MTTQNVESVYPLSPMQRGMLFQCLSEPDTGLYVEQIRLDLDGLDPDLFRRAFGQIVERHPSLRTSIVGSGLADPVQVVRREVELPWLEQDWSECSAEDRELRLEAFLEADRERGFELDAPALVRVALLRTGARCFTCVWTLHHIVLDGWSGGLVLKDVFDSYAALQEGSSPDLPERRSFRDYVLWLRDQDLSPAEAHWRAALRGFAAPTVLGLGDGVGHAGAPVAAYDQRELRLAADATASLRRCAARAHVTLGTLLQGAWALWLGVYSGERDVVFGTVVAGRPETLDGVDAMIGMFVNTLPTRVRILPERSAADWLRALQRAQAEERQYSFSPLWRVQEWSELPAGTPLFESLFVLENYGVDGRDLRVDGLDIRIRPPFDRIGYPLMLLVEPGEELALRVTFDAERFTGAAIERLLEQVRQLLHRLADGPDQPLARLVAPDEEERALVVDRWNQTEVSHPSGVCLHDLFERQQARAPAALAVVDGAVELTYRELAAQSRRLAHELRARGVGPERTVGVCVERSSEMIVAVLGVLEAGGAYVPLDPAHPLDRLAHVAEDADLALVIAHAATAALAGALGAAGRREVLLLEPVVAASDGSLPERPSSGVEPSGLAYVLYTSGSTGRPKGVAMPHAPLVNLLHWQLAQSSSGPGDRTLQFASLGFDVSCQEIFATLGSGGTLCLVDDELRRDPEALLARVRECSVARLFVPFVALQQLAEAAVRLGTALPALREIVTAGEQLRTNATLARFFRGMPGCRLVNQYGPTECHVVSSFTLPAAPEDWPSLPPIGRPIDNTRLYVLDAELQPVPVGAPGELCVGGAAVGRGYLGDEELTRRSFLPDPFARDPQGRLYRTGDRARHRPDGEIEFLGRADDQVKVRGHRVELGEVEAVLLDHARVRDAAAVVREDRPGDRRLVAYFVAAGAAPPAAELREHLARHLPEFMLPAALVPLEQLPTTSSGKVDRRALLREAHAPAELRAGYVAPRGPEEEALAEVWADVLGVARPGVRDDFFDLGGHSILATQLVSRIRDVLQVELPLRSLFAHTTIAALAAEIRRSRGGAAEASQPLSAVSRDGELPLSFAQQRLWFLDQMGAGTAYNMPWAFRLDGALDLDALTSSLRAIVRRHEPLRTSFRAVNGKPVQTIVSADELRLDVQRIDLAGLAPVERDARVEELARREADEPFDLASARVLRPTVIRLGDGEHLLFLSVHHIAFDGWSIHVLHRELRHFYRAFTSGEDPGLPELPVQYADFARWQTEWMQGPVREDQLDYWRAQLADLPVLRLPTDRPRPAAQSYRGAAVPLELSPELVRSLQLLSRREGVTLAMTLLAAFETLLARYSGQDDIAVGAPIAGRTRSEIEGLIGFFVNSIVLRCDLSGDPSFQELLHRVQTTSLAAYEHQDLPFELLVDELQPERDPSRNPLFQIVFAMQNASNEPLQLPGLEVRPFETETRKTRFDLELHLAEAGEGLTGGFCYNCDLFDRATLERMVGHFLVLLEGIVVDPRAPLSQLPLLSEDERRQLVDGRDDAPSTFQVEGCLHESFERQVERTPDAPAVSFEEERLTYRELDERANRLAHHLRAKGVGPEVLVGLSVDRNLELVVAILGILKAGGGYVPLDLANPKERIAFILEDTGIALLVTESSQLESLPEHAAEIVCVDRERGEIEALSAERPDAGARPENVAYVIYTSGSTGVPKGVLVEHRTVTRLFPATAEWFRFDETDVWTLFHSCAFDFSVWELWGALLHGGRLAVVPYWVSRSPEEFLELLVRERVTVLNQTPSAFRQLDAADAARADGDELALRLVVFGGEALDLQSLRPWFERHGDERPQLVNMYGITETTVHVTYRPLSLADLSDAPGSVIGRPIPDLQVYILDRHLGLVPLGVPGEMYVGGAGVARGYLDRPQLTEQRFVPDPFRSGPGARLYRTGDVARFLGDGDIEYLGRNDEQVKVRGFRIELGEIEAALGAHPWVRESVVASRADGDGSTRLVAYVVPDPEGASSEELEVVGQWSTLYDDTYARPPEDADPTFNVIGWDSSYTTEPIPAGEMREWVDETVGRIRRGDPKGVLEIGCGTGLLLFRVAPDCDEYVGTDVSPVALEHVARHLPDELAGRVTLQQRPADELTGVPAGHFDVVVLNSVVQYFPSVAYLIRVLEGAVASVAPGGRVLIGDVRNLRLLEAFHSSVALFGAAGDAATASLGDEVRQHVAQEEELVIDPALFLALAHHLPRVTHVEIEPKHGRARNELTAYRYEVTLHVEGTDREAAEIVWRDWRSDALSFAKLRELLRAGRVESLGIRGVPNARTQADCRGAELLLRGGSPETVDLLRERLSEPVEGGGVEPADLRALAEELGYRVALSWAAPSDAGELDALFTRGAEPALFPAPSLQPLPWSTYANQPLQARMTRQLAPKLRDSLSESLPDYMVPAAFVTLESLPLTANGKVNRAALPEPDWFLNARRGEYRAPGTATERQIAAIWSELLGVPEVGADDDFFELGGHSLLATQVMSRLRESLEVELPLRQLFEAPRLSRLAELVDGLQWARDARSGADGLEGLDREQGEL